MPLKLSAECSATGATPDMPGLCHEHLCYLIERRDWYVGGQFLIFEQQPQC